MVETAQGYTSLDSFADTSKANPNGWNGETLDYTPNQDKSLLPEGSWVAFDVPPATSTDLAALTSFGISLGVGLGSDRLWSGTFYIDDVQLKP